MLRVTQNFFRSPCSIPHEELTSTTLNQRRNPCSRKPTLTLSENPKMMSESWRKNRSRGEGPAQHAPACSRNLKKQAKDDHVLLEWPSVGQTARSSFFPANGRLHRTAHPLVCMCVQCREHALRGDVGGNCGPYGCCFIFCRKTLSARFLLKREFASTFSLKSY